MTERLQTFVQPFAKLLGDSQRQKHARTYVVGLLSNLKRKNTESIAYFHDQDRQGLQRFIGWVPWDYEPLLQELTRQVGQELGEPDGVIVFDPSGFAKKGTESVGVQRQWIGRFGKIDNGQVGVYMGYVSRREQALVDMRLFLPKEWASDKKRRKKSGVPKQVRFQTRHQLALSMLSERGSGLPHTWVAGDDEMGRSSSFRRDLRNLKERYLLAVPSNTLVRDLDVAPPPYQGRGQPRRTPFARADQWRAALPEKTWQRIDVRDGDKGALTMDIVKVRVAAKMGGRRTGPEEILVVTRTKDEAGNVKHDYYLSNAPAETTLAEFARVANAEHRIEECIKRAKSEAGLAHYEVRTWRGWHHHQTLSLLATWFLVQETQRGKKIRSRVDCSTSSLELGDVALPGNGLWQTATHRGRLHPTSPTQRTRSVLSLQKT
jgi:SRSO17 transposase